MSLDRFIPFFNSPFGTVVLIIVIAAFAHLLILLIYSVAIVAGRKMSARTISKWRAVWKLAKTILVFLVYYLALGRIVQFIDIPYAHYLIVSAILIVAVVIGAKSLIQDIFAGISIIFSETLRSGQMVEINQHTGVVYSLGMRFTIIKDYLGAKVFIPNRTIQKVIYYPKGYLSCLIDVMLSLEEDSLNQEMSVIRKLVKSTEEQFPAVFIGKSNIDSEHKPSNGKNYTRIKFKLWPGRGELIESFFKGELISSIQTINAEFSEKMITINYEIEKPTHKLRQIAKPNGNTSKNH